MSLPSAVHDVLRSPGQPLDEPTRAVMEPAFGHDFSGVRVHTDAGAATSAQAVNARAYTVGHNLVFGANQYNPNSQQGGRLLAHELTHVVQQNHSSPSLQGSKFDSPDSSAEREADLVGAKFVAREPFSIPRAQPSVRLQRDVLNKVETNFQSDPKTAKACLVHLHGEEHTALAVAKELRGRRCLNLVHLDTYSNPAALQRYVRFNISVDGNTHECAADPNRVFTDAGLDKNALNDEGCHLSGKSARTDKDAKVKAEAVKAMKGFAADWGGKISECRGGGGSSPTDGTLPTLALHNNEIQMKEGKPVPLLDSYKDVAEKGERLPPDPKDPSKKAKNPLVKPGEGINDFYLVTKPDDFTALSKKGTVFLQADPIPAKGDDGSLSVVLAQHRFINLEKTGCKNDELIAKPGGFQAHDAVYVKNYSMAVDALEQLGVPEGPCFSRKLTPEEELMMIEGAPSNWIRDRLKPGKSLNPPQVLATDKALLGRDTTAAAKGCQLFETQQDLDTEKAVWQKTIERLPMVEIINWITGGPNAVPAEVTSVVKKQQTCMMTAMATALKAAGLKLPTGSLIRSELRTYADQEGIWKPKFNFTFDKKFGRITDEARTKCGSAIKTTEVEWDPKNTDHAKCWKEKLSGEEKEREILTTSSAPGVSRHHAGTEFDIGRAGVEKDLTMEAWTGTGEFADAYSWLARSASRYGFIQRFDNEGGPGKGYTAERWHWSYYPIAQALLEFAFDHQSEIDTELAKHWEAGGKTKPEFEFISKNWRKYMFNVENQGRF